MTSSRGMVRYVELGFLLIVLAGAVYVPIEASRWPIQARLFPMVVALPLLAITVIQLVLVTRGKPAQPVTPEEAELEELGLWHPAARQRTLRLALWIAAFVLSVVLFSFPLGLALAIFCYLRFESREPWLLCIVLAAVTFGYMHLVFDMGLHLPWPDALLSQLF